MSSVIAVAVVLTGCGGKVAEEISTKAVEKAVEKNLSADGEKVDVDLDAEGDSFSMTVSGGDGQTQMTMGAQAKVPDGFPKDVPLYPGMAMQMAMSGGAENAFSLQATTKDSLDKVAAYYKAQAEKQGWSEEMSMNQGGDQPMKMLNYSKEGRVINLVLAVADGETQISLTTATE